MAFFKFRPGAHASAEESALDAETQSVENLRRRARQRLIGAAVLVIVAVAGFPMVFDTLPRPVSTDLSIDIPGKSKQPSDAPPEPIKPGAGLTPNETLAPAAVRVDDSQHALGDKEELVKAPDQSPAITPAPPAGAAAVAKNQTDPSNAAKKVAPEGRYVVQVGAFLEESKVRETRAKLEKAGLKTYTQVVDGKDGKRTRVRVGPFATKADAETAAEKAKSLQLQAIVLTF